MKKLLALAALSASLALGACGTTGQTVLNNVNQACDRHYEGTINGGLTGGSFTGTLKADCKAQGVKVGDTVPQ